MAGKKKVSGTIVDVVNGRIYSGTLVIEYGRISDIVRENRTYNRFIIPGFIDSHVHIESSMLPPSEFARAATIHGTIAAVCDPHEIANVCGVEGIDYMCDNAAITPMKFYFGAPSCVPATDFETSGACLDADTVDSLLQRSDIWHLGEMMNYPGVINGDPSVLRKIRSALQAGKPVDGHAPGLLGIELRKYIDAGITTNHECLSPEEALEDIKAGITVQIREGSAARLLDQCFHLIDLHTDHCMFCSDDKHPDDLQRGYINDMVKRSIQAGIDPLKVLKVASVNPVFHYGLDMGLLRRGDPADFLEIDDLQHLNILRTWIGGTVVASEGVSLIPRCNSGVINRFDVSTKTPEDFVIRGNGNILHVIIALDRQVYTEKTSLSPKRCKDMIVSDPDHDVLKLAVVNRYADAPVSIGFVKNFGLREGAIASSVAHDSHNIVAVGVRDSDLARAVNLIIKNGGGICAVRGEEERIQTLPIAGLMSNEDFKTVSKKYTLLNRMAQTMGTQLKAPFMTLSFMSLPVIPRLKLTDRGLFDGDLFRYIDSMDSV